MRIAFPAAEYPDVPVERGRVRIGSDADNGLVLDAEHGILPSHLQVEVESRRGIVLSALSEAAKIWINGRPVREKAIVRVGDMIIAGQVRMVIKGDEDPPEAPAEPLEGTAAAEMGPTQPMLRGHVGSHVGRGIALMGRTIVGSAADCDVVVDEPHGVDKLLEIEARGGRLALRLLAPDQQVEVNGVMVRSALLASGDQIALRNNRFVVEAPGWNPPAADVAVKKAPAHTQVGRPLVVPPPEPEATEATENTVDWVILAAAIVTIGALGVLVYLQFWGQP